MVAPEAPVDPRGESEPAAERDADTSPPLDAAFLRAVEHWEQAPHNHPGTDKTWVERLFRETREHLKAAVRQLR